MDHIVVSVDFMKVLIVRMSNVCDTVEHITCFQPAYIISKKCEPVISWYVNVHLEVI